MKDTRKKVNLSATCMHVAHDKKKNVEKYMEFIEKAADKGTDLIAFPECSLQGYTWTWDPVRSIYTEDEEQRKYFLDNSETVPGPSTDVLSRKAKRHGLYIQFGLAEKVHSNKRTQMFNTAVLLGPDGLIGKFRKVHMAPNPVFERGDRFQVFDTNLGRIGSIICADLQYPESVRCLALDGADIIVNSTAWGMNGSNPNIDYSGYKYEVLSKANAMMNQVWMVHSAQIGSSTKSHEYTYGHARIVDPMGRIRADTGFREGMAYLSVDISEEIEKSKNGKYARKSILDSRRPNAYRQLWKN